MENKYLPIGRGPSHFIIKGQWQGFLVGKVTVGLTSHQSTLQTLWSASLSVVDLYTAGLSHHRKSSDALCTLVDPEKKSFEITKEAVKGKCRMSKTVW